ncbi:hypothetical protein PanWU01x14_013520 [Parasponia andersonii]|uniref:Uncharacterized protein n=1 Tax=Parasponia andersonii TaxID=3476 RepID=A0A2P5E128_PARAD|nr:hypothetical protein PanWU01x14_013520 [Parasponia andersonii]
MEHKDCLDCFFGPPDLPMAPSSSSHQQNDQSPTKPVEPIESVPIPILNIFESIPEEVSTPIPAPARPYDLMRFPKVYSRKKVVPDLTQVQNDFLSHVTEDEVCSDLSPIQSVEIEIRDLDLPIAIRKSTRECTK